MLCCTVLCCTVLCCTVLCCAGVWHGLPVAVKVVALQARGSPSRPESLGEGFRQATNHLSALSTLSHPHLLSHLDTLLQPHAVDAEPSPHPSLSLAATQQHAGGVSGAGEGARAGDTGPPGAGMAWRLCLVQVT